LVDDNGDNIKDEDCNDDDEGSIPFLKESDEKNSPNSRLSKKLTSS